MEKSYDENPYRKEFTAEIINIIEKDNTYHVELDNTYFFPNNPVQPGDTGFINEIPVTNVYEEKGKIFHVVNIKPLKIHRVTCIIDFQKKINFMQQHLAQHILSYCFSDLFNLNTTCTQLENNNCYIDLDKNIESHQLKAIEAKANKIISENLSIETLYVSNAELKKLVSKKLQTKGNDKTRIVKIGDIYATPCHMSHLKSTIEVQVIKIVNNEKRGNITRIHFICGSRAVFDYFSKYEAINKMSKTLCCKDTEVLDRVEGLSAELKKTLAENGALKAEVADYEVKNIINTCENINNIRLIKTIYDEADSKYINTLATKLALFPKVVVLFGIKTKEKTQLIFMKSKDLDILNMNLLLKDAITLIDGKGGGSDFSAQGAGKNPNNLNSCIEYAYNKIKDSILKEI